MSNRGFVAQVTPLGLASFLNAALAISQSIVIARVLGPNLFGLTALIVATPELIASLVGARTSPATIKYLTYFQSSARLQEALALLKWLYTLDVINYVVVFAIVSVPGYWIVNYLVPAENAYVLMIIFTASFIGVNWGNTSRSTLSVFGRFRLMSILDILVALVRTVVVLTLTLTGRDITSLIIGLSIGHVFRGFIYASVSLIITRREWGAMWVNGTYSRLSEHRREIIRFVFANQLNELLGALVKRTDIILLGIFRPPVEVGYYRLGKSVVGHLGNVVIPLQTVAFQRLLELDFSKDTERLRVLVTDLGLRIGLPAAILASGATFAIPWVLRVIVGDAFLPAAAITQILYLGGIVWLGMFWLRPAYIATNHMGLWVKLALINASLTVIGFIIAAPIAGAVGVAWVTLFVPGILSHTIATITFFRVIKRETIPVSAENG